MTTSNIAKSQNSGLTPSLPGLISGLAGNSGTNYVLAATKVGIETFATCFHHSPANITVPIATALDAINVRSGPGTNYYSLGIA